MIYLTPVALQNLRQVLADSQETGKPETSAWLICDICGKRAGSYEPNSIKLVSVKCADCSKSQSQ